MDLELPTAVSGDEDLDQRTPRITVNVKSDGSLRAEFAPKLKDGGVPGLFRKIGLRIIREETALLGMVRVWVGEKM